MVLDIILKDSALVKVLTNETRSALIIHCAIGKGPIIGRLGLFHFQFEKRIYHIRPKGWHDNVNLNSTPLYSKDQAFGSDVYDEETDTYIGLKNNRVVWGPKIERMWDHLEEKYLSDLQLSKRKLDSLDAIQETGALQVMFKNDDQVDVCVGVLWPDMYDVDREFVDKIRTSIRNKGDK